MRRTHGTTSVTRAAGSPGGAPVGLILFASLFAGQAAVIAMSPVLAQAASDLHVSTAAAGQLRTLTGLVAGATALLLPAIAARVALGRLLLAAAALLAVASLASAAAPSYALLAVAQAPVGVAVAVLTSAGTLAAAEWTPPELRTRTLSWALVGQPAAWIVGMPVIGLVGEGSWRYGWLALPLVAAVAAAVLLAPRAGGPPVAIGRARLGSALRERSLARWLAAELLANTAWAGTLVYAGALVSESYGCSPALTGGVLSGAGAAYVAGNLLSRRLVRHEARRVLVLLAVCLALADALFGIVRPDVATSSALLAGASFAAGARTLVSSAFALAAPPDLRASATSLRASTMQLGYFVGSLLGGAALATADFGGLGAALALCFVAAAATLLRGPSVSRSSARSAALPRARA